jgi:hypothetical protein
MSHITVEKEKKPLSYGFISGDSINFKVKYDFMNELTYFDKLGKGLLDFAWIDIEYARNIFDLVFRTYLPLKQHRNEYGFIAAGILQRFERLFTMNTYFSMYLMAFLDFLLESRIDYRVLSKFEVERFAQSGYLTEVETSEMFDLDKRRFIDVFLSSISQRQKRVEQTLNDVLVDKKDNDSSPMARFYRYEMDDKLFRQQWSSHFEVFFGKKNENSEEVTQLTVLRGIDDMMRFELVQMLVQDVQYKRCQSCEKLFIPSGRSDSLYCGRIMPGQKKPCNQIGANLVAKKKLGQNPALRLYRQAYHRLSKRVEFGYMTAEAFAEWKAKAVPKREQCLRGEISLEDFTLWINETSRQRQEEGP